MSRHTQTTVSQLDQEFGRILEESLNEIYIFDAESLNFLQVNRGARENLGYTAQELHRLTPLDLKPEFAKEAFEQLIAPLRTGQRKTLSFDARHRRKDGSYYDVEVHLQKSTCHGRPVFVAIILDTTERNQATRMLEERQARLQAVLNTAVEAIITIDSDGICESVNPSAEAMFGYAASELIGSNISMLMPPPFRDEHDTYLANYLRTGEKKIIGIGREVIGQRKDGSEFPVHLSVSEVRLGDRLLFTGIIQDITERKESERRLIQSERLAAVGEAMTSLAHESRNLLQKIQMSVELGRLECTNDEALAYHLNRIEKSSDGLQALLDEVRNFAAPIRLEPSATSLPDLWREAWDSLQRERHGREVNLCEHIDGTSVECTLDRFRLIQVFRNLLENSLSMCADPVNIFIRVTETHRDGADWLQILVEDNGPGLTDEQKKRIFDPFFSTKAKGTGLGMTIAQRIVEAHGGKIAIREEGSPGACVQIDLPREIV